MKRIAYYGSRISDHISKTPEGFLICRDVPIARVGVQEYLGREIGQDDKPDDIFKVDRPEEEVFSPAAMASFEGKLICDNHPEVDVTADNYGQFARGVCRDVRKGTGKFAGCLVADLIIHDGALVRSVQNGKREISCGYNCLWVPTGDHTLVQREIRGNHVAVVDKGRAGHGVAIHDNAMQRRNKPMKKGSIWNRMFRAFIKDAEPDEIDEAVAAMNAKGQDAEPAPAAQPEDPTEARFKSIEDSLAKVLDSLEALQKPAEPAVQDNDPDPAPAPAPDDEPDALDSLEKELQAPSPEGQESKVTADPDDINAQQSQAEDEDPGLISADNDEDDPQAVRDAAMEAIQALKPLVAGIHDKAQRKRATDALAALIRTNVQDSGYLAIQSAAKAAHAHDSAPEDDVADLGRKIAEKWNPHYKNKD